MTDHTFEVGDRVYCVSRAVTDPVDFGDRGTVIHVGGAVFVKWDTPRVGMGGFNVDEWAMTSHELELLVIPTFTPRAPVNDGGHAFPGTSSEYVQGVRDTRQYAGLSVRDFAALSIYAAGLHQPWTLPKEDNPTARAAHLAQRAAISSEAADAFVKYRSEQR